MIKFLLIELTYNLPRPHYQMINETSCENFADISCSDCSQATHAVLHAGNEVKYNMAE